jgi:hypothetical protein
VKKEWRKPEVKSIEAGSAEQKTTLGNDGKTPAPTAS